MMTTADGVLGSGPAPQPTGKVKAFLRLVMIEHSVFALPFAYIAALTAMFRLDRTMHWPELLLVTVCMVGLRTFAMAANRIIDREIDARNRGPRGASSSRAPCPCGRPGPGPGSRSPGFDPAPLRSMSALFRVVLLSTAKPPG